MIDSAGLVKMRTSSGLSEMARSGSVITQKSHLRKKNDNAIPLKSTEIILISVQRRSSM